MIIKKYFLIIFIFTFFVSGCNSIEVINKNNNTSVTDKAQLNASTQSKEEKIITSNNVADLIAEPDKILYYHMGKETIINKDTDKYNNIVKMIKERCDGNIGLYKSAISESDIADQKQTNDVVEFIYSNNVEAHWKANLDNDFQYNFSYKSLLFPLSGDKNSWMIFLPIQNGPLGPLKSPDDLLKYLNS